MEIIGINIRNLFDGLCATFIECVNIIPLDLNLLNTLTGIPNEILNYLVTATGVSISHLQHAIGDAKISFANALAWLHEAVNALIETFRCFICALQAAGIEHIAVVDILLPLDLVIIISTLGYIVYDSHVCRILLGPVRIRGVPKKIHEIEKIITTHEVYKYLESCLYLGDFYEHENTIFTVGSTHLREFTKEAAKKFMTDVWNKSSLR